MRLFIVLCSALVVCIIFSAFTEIGIAFMLPLFPSIARRAVLNCMVEILGDDFLWRGFVVKSRVAATFGSSEIRPTYSAMCLLAKGPKLSART